MSETVFSRTGGLFRSAMVLFLLLLGVSLKAQAPGNGLVTLDMTDVPVEQVMKMIEEQTDYVFLNKDVDVSRIVSVHVTDSPIEEVLKAIFDGKGISFKIESRHIVLSESPLQNPDDRGGNSVEDNVISGTVIDSYGTPVIGAGVLIKGTTTGASTDLDGNFSFVLPDGMETGTLEVSCLGYTTMEFSIGTRRVRIHNHGVFHRYEKGLQCHPEG